MTAAIMLLVGNCITAVAERKLSFRSDGTFKVLQLADLHFGEAEGFDWGPEQDRNSTQAIRKLLRTEQPDLVVFSGDQVTGNNIRDNATAYWQRLVEPCEELGVPWATVFGNHDTKSFEGGRLAASSTTSRQALMSFDTSRPLSRSSAGALLDGRAVSNFVLDIFAPPDAWNGAAPARLYFFDTGGGDYEQVVYEDQVAWFRNVSAEGPSSVFAYLHIPLAEYSSAWGRPGCVGMNENGGVTPVDSDGGLFEALAQAGVRAAFVGHDHGNDWCCPSDAGPWLCFGRHSGYGGYGTWARGARMLGLQLNSSVVTARSWVRLESGEKIHEVFLSGSVQDHVV